MQSAPRMTFWDLSCMDVLLVFAAIKVSESLLGDLFCTC